MKERMIRVLIVLPLLLLMSGTVLADESGGQCENDADCPQGFSCDVVGGMSAACVCASDEEECECDEESNTSEEWKACRPKACQSDTDCGADLQCHSFTVECDDVMVPEWDCPEDKPDCNDDLPNPEPCEPTVKGVCGPTWIGVCETANDCGPGFDCKPVETCACSGSSGAPPTIPGDTDSSGGDDDADDDGDDAGSGASTEPVPAPDDGGSGKADEAETDEDCDCTPSDDSYCQLIETICSTDSDCPIDGWACAEMDDSGGVCSFDFETGEERCEEMDDEMQCTPPGYELWSEGLNDLGDSPTGAMDDGTSMNKTESAAPGSGNDESSGGCRAGGPASTGLLPLSMLLLWLMRRRQSPEFESSIRRPTRG